MTTIINDPDTGEITNLSALRDMPEDKVVYVVPWAWREEQEYLDLGYHYHNSPTGTATMQVLRDGNEFTVIDGDDVHYWGRE